MTTNIYQQALLVQDACNPSGVAHSLVSEILPAIRAEAGYDGTAYICNHPAFILFVDKLAHLAGIQFDTDKIHAAYWLAREKAAAV